MKRYFNSKTRKIKTILLSPSFGLNIKSSLLIFLYEISKILFSPLKLVNLYDKFFTILHKIKIPRLLIISTKIGKFNCRNLNDLFHVSPSYEQEVTILVEKIISNLPKDSIFIDIGAHIGRYTIMVGNLGIKVVSFEPEKSNFMQLKYNIKINKLDELIIPIQIALSEKRGFTYLYFNKEDSGSHSIVKKVSKIEERVATDSLDNIIKMLNIGIKKIKLIKIDVEGAELKVLKGAKNILKSSRPILIFESWNKKYYKKVSTFLKEFNYKIVPIDKTNFMAFANKNPFISTIITALLNSS